ncbi:sensor histidine kinase [Diaminobutyricimonas sp. LJ205]|uniref:sensor histidine kinase n=1 Tax=Diaminobutyricimonas sp. LJ205 TaxID=2683590 RepID=UPI0018E03190|nr:sensor histidine kinase [Diaminobutyricimonas sp. LJ205]
MPTTGGRAQTSVARAVPWVLWMILLGGAVAVVASLPAAWRLHTTICDGSHCPAGTATSAAASRLESIGLSLPGYAAAGLAMLVLITAACLIVAALLLRSSSSNAGALVGAAALIAIGVAFPQTIPALAVENPELAWLPALVDGSIVLVAWWVASFPDGIIRTRIGWAAVAASVVFAILPWLGLFLRLPGWLAPTLTLVTAGLLLSALITNLLTAPPERRRVMGGALSALAGAILVLSLATILQNTDFVVVGTLVDLALQTLLMLAFLAMPMAIAGAVLRRGLWGTAPSIVRTLSATAVTTVALGVFIAGALVLGTLGAEPAVALAVPVTVVALALQPLAAGVHALVRRLLTGSTADRQRALGDLGASLAIAADLDRAPESVADAVAAALGWRTARVVGSVPGQSERDAGGDVWLPLLHASSVEGWLVLTPRRPGAMLEPSQREAIAPVAAHLASVLHANRLAEDLRDSRRALVVAREDERRRVRDDLHDHVGPTLAAAVMTLGAAEHESSRNPEAATGYVRDARQQVSDAVATIRRIVYGLRPPALDDLGLVGAVTAFTRGLQTPMTLTVESGTSLPPLSASVESAAYAITLECVSNALRHSGGTECSVRIHMDRDELVIEIEDNGRGVISPIDGVGTESIRQRAAELGGSFERLTRNGDGTLARTRLPTGPNAQEESA